jgi:hypothetical protein
MSERKFKFISPGVFTSEIDNSQLPKVPDPIGPVIIGRTRKGPAFRPTTVNSFEEFIQVFGDPVAGGKGGDVWRDGNELAPTYASFAAQAWLKNSNAVTVVRLLGQQHPDVSDGAANAGAAGYEFDGIDDSNSSQGAYGLFVWPSGSAASNGYTISGTLAAVFYVEEGRVILSGTNARGAMTASGCQLFKSDANGEFVAQIHGASNLNEHNPSERVTFNFDPASDRFIRKVFNTNPTLVNDDVSTATLADGTNRVNYVLGESFERKVLKGSAFRELFVDGAAYTGDVMFGAIMPLQNPQTPAEEHGDFKFSATKATTGWFISQDMTDSSGSYAAENQQRLFRLEARDVGEQVQKSIKLSIQNVKASTTNADPYGTFDVVVRDIRDTDNRQRVLERFTACNLNPASPDYIANRIGDQHDVYDSAEKRNRRYGEYANRSDYVRVVMNGDVERGATDPRLLPFGFFGPTKYRDVDIVSGSTSLHAYGKGQGGTAGGGSVHSMLDGGGAGFGTLVSHATAGIMPTDTQILDMGKANMTASIRFPELPLVVSSSYGSPNSKEVTHFGVYTGQSIANNRYNPELADIVRSLSVNFKDYTAEASLDLAQVNADTAATPDVPVRQADTSTAGSSARQHSFVFSLDNVGPVPGKASEAKHYYGLRKAGFSYTAGAAHGATGAREASFTTGSYQKILDAGYNNFTTVLHGGHDGLNIKESEPFNNTRLGTDETAAYALHSVVRALDLVRDPEDVQSNLLSVPGITSTIVTDKMLEVAEDRGDMLAVIDLGSVFTPSTENTSNYQTRAGNTVKTAVDALTNREINTSYGAAYYPWVRARDTLTGKLLWLPPSIPALGAMSFTDRVGAPWFAPAGLARGGLSDGAGGLPIIDVTKKLTSKDRDDLYAAGINPIAKFPAEGIVIFGQKTLQTTPSALDRVNVRRLMIFIKREISRVAARVVFAQNTRETWNRFLGEAEPILRNVKAQFGLEDFRLILDESTTTPDLIDRNIIYAKVLLKPTRTAEFFAIDFSIARSGASFAD